MSAVVSTGKSPYARRIERARVLLREQTAAAELLLFYIEIAGLQQTIYAEVETAELDPLVRRFPDLLALTDRFAPQLAAFAWERLSSGESRLDALRARWESSMELDPRASFFAHALLAPFALKLASRGAPAAAAIQPSCPFCGSKPGMAVLRPEGEGGRRFLLCSLCSTEWLFRRILCPNCGEEDRSKLPAFVPESPAHVRIEACDSCGTYLKAIDLTKYGLAEPVVDELATVTLNIWAEEHGYVKIAPNVMGM